MVKYQKRDSPHSIDLDEIIGKELIRLAKAEPFYCYTCDGIKVSRLRAKINTTTGERTVCNGCYGTIISLEREHGYKR